MELDEELCLCFHVTKRKVVNFLRVERPRRVGQLSECFGAGTGCGWCRPYLRRLFEESQGRNNENTDPLPTADQYALLRAHYVRAGKGTPPPGATALPEE
jgi:NAD(P)H-nitrite reductase large subunit